MRIHELYRLINSKLKFLKQTNKEEFLALSEKIGTDIIKHSPDDPYQSNKKLNKIRESVVVNQFNLDNEDILIPDKFNMVYSFDKDTNPNILKCTTFLP